MYNGDRFLCFSDCDAFNSFANIDMTMKHAVLPKHVTVTCVNKNRLLVTWEQPKGNRIEDNNNILIMQMFCGIKAKKPAF